MSKLTIGTNRFVNCLCALFPMLLFAAPSGEKVVHGSAKIERPQADFVQITQEGSHAIVEWDNFSLNSNETAKFIQPAKDSAILNRVVGGNLSEIHGRMESNGQIFLVNPHGVLVGENGRIDCGGFTGAGLDLDNDSFLAGNMKGFKGGDGTVTNRGHIIARSGRIDLIGVDVQNEGEAAATRGVFLQIGGEEFPVMVRTTMDQLSGEIDNAYALAINQEGTQDALIVRNQDGRIFLDDVISSAPAFQYVDVKNVPFPDGGIYMEKTQNALQQLGSVIPERLWYQRFAILVDENKYQAAQKNLPGHASHLGMEPTVAIGKSHYYFMQNTLIGDPIRISDDYQQFLDSPYWKTPNGMEELTNLQNKVLK